VTTFLEKTLKQPKSFSSILIRTPENPILRSNPEHGWESFAVFNTAAIYLENKVHLIYRAISNAGASVFGYAASQDGIHIDERLAEPVYMAADALQKKETNIPPIVFPYASGGSWSGCEDPRLVKIDDTIYMTYTAFNGWQHPPAVALSSIKVKDFLKKIWQWKNPIQLSPYGEMHKNWVIFPERIKGKFALLHSIAPDIQIDYFDTLDFDHNPCIKSSYSSSGRDKYWDNWIRGVGPPPLKTDAGWLVLYHAMDKRDPNRYKIGALILDINDPAKILYRANKPLLEPDASYENEGYKAGVVYSCGAVVIGEKLFVYYGGADTVICAAVADLQDLLARIMHDTGLSLS
jgi:predicted GH43/DUF377 family glycosyl hydrolase